MGEQRIAIGNVLSAAKDAFTTNIRAKTAGVVALVSLNIVYDAFQPADGNIFQAVIEEGDHE